MALPVAVSGWSKSTSSTIVEQAGDDWPGSSSGSRATKQCSQPGEIMGKPEEGRPVEQSPGQSAIKKRAVQEGLILKSDKNTQFQIREKEPCIDMTVSLFLFMCNYGTIAIILQ